MMEITLADIRYREMQGIAQDHLIREAARDNPRCISRCPPHSTWE